MARLNEPPVSSESIESLKRRFVRQNRDLARCNSQQSIKIRALETELHHCLSENATLRTRILALETELADTRTLDIRNGVAQLRDRLTSHFASIVAELTELEKKPRRRKSQLHLPVSPKRSPQQREWRNVSTLGEVLASQGGTLPTILEDKHFPRRTLDVVDVQRLIDDADTDSPEIGPPPRTFLDHEQIEAHDPQPRSPRSQNLADEPDAESKFDAIEIRRRRRSSKIRVEESTETAHPIKAGAKRKMDFVEAQEPAQVLTSPRKVLGDKSVNTDPVVTSPVKSVQPAANGKKTIPSRNAPSKPPSRPADKVKPPVRPISRTSRTPSTPSADNNTTKSAKPTKLDSQPPQEVAKPFLSQPEPPKVKTEPKTPHPLDIFSPVSSQPSASEAAPPTRPATPPPTNITTASTSASSATDIAAGGRGSRRGGRPAVSYAEPKINTKMRRPGKEMADAVVLPGTGVKREGRSESREPDLDGCSRTGVRIKQEEDGEAAEIHPRGAKHLNGIASRPAIGSPLDNRTRPLPHDTSQPRPTPATTDPQQLLDIFDVQDTPPAPASTAVAAVLKPRANLLSERKDREITLAPAAAAAAATESSVTSRRASSAAASDISTAVTSASAITARSKARRQTLSTEVLTSSSSSPSSPSSATATTTTKSNDQAPTTSTAAREVPVRNTGVRRMSSVGSVRSSASGGGDAGGEVRRDQHERVVNGNVNVRAERAGRIAERRRSMML